MMIDINSRVESCSMYVCAAVIFTQQTYSSKALYACYQSGLNVHSSCTKSFLKRALIMERSLAGGMDQFFITPFMALIVQKKLQATYARLYAISFFRLRRVTKLKRRSEKENLENISFDNNYYYFGGALMSANHAT